MMILVIAYLIGFVISTIFITDDSIIEGSSISMLAVIFWPLAIIPLLYRRFLKW